MEKKDPKKEMKISCLFSLIFALGFWFILFYSVYFIPVFLWFLWMAAQHDDNQEYSEEELAAERRARATLAILVPILTVSAVSILVMVKRMCCQDCSAKKREDEELIKDII